MRTLYLVRGIPGSGKSTLAERIVGNRSVYSADDYFMKNGKYEYDHEHIKDAHAYCKRMCEERMSTSDDDIAVANTFCRRWEMEDYIEMAKHYGYKVVEIICRGKFKNIHGVPFEKVEEMRSKFEY